VLYDKCAGYRHLTAVKLEMNSIVSTYCKLSVFQQFSFENGKLVPV